MRTYRFGLNLDVSSFTGVGMYPVVLSVEDENNNTATGEAVVTVVNSTVSTEDNLLAKTIFVYPNPANDKIYIDYSNNSMTSLKVHVYNASGQLVKTINDYHSSDTIYLSQLANGLYLFKITNDDKSHFVKLVVNR